MNTPCPRHTWLIFLLVCGITGTAFAQIDTLQINQSQSDSLEPQQRLIPWKNHPPISSEQVTNDSLLRWQIWPNWVYKKNRDPGVVSYRLGTIGRTSSFKIQSYESRHQRLYWEDIPLHDPVSGTVNWNFLPQHRINALYESGNGITHNTRFNLVQYYINKPLTKLIFDESKFDLRSLEFLVSHNLSQKTNVELSFWDRRDGGGYQNSSLIGRQVFAKVFHQFSDTQALKIRFLNNNLDLGEPFGYIVPDLERFNFNHFDAVPSQGSAKSETGASTIGISYYSRRKDTLATYDNFQASVFLDSRKRELRYSADTTRYSIKSVGAGMQKWIDWRLFKLEGNASYQLYSNGESQQSGITKQNWGLLRTAGKAVFTPFEGMSLEGNAAYRYRSDGETGMETGAGIRFEFGRFRAGAHAGTGSLMPTIQQLYWQSEEFGGNPSLANEEITGIQSDIEFHLFDHLKLGVKGDLKHVDNAPVVGVDSVFTGLNEYRSISLAPYVDFNSPSFEVSASAVLNRTEDLPDGLSQPVLTTSETIWYKGGAYWKGYLFNRATFVKAGVSGVMAPQAYRADHYNPVLDFWQPVSDDQSIPAYSRLDVDISARVRMIMFVLRYENVLNEVNQLGYFETAQYPMPGRRFMFGVRALFRN